MRVLLDTQIVLWWMTDDKQLTQRAESTISNPDNEIYVSAASIWEIAIKASIGRMQGDIEAIVGAIHPSGFIELPITGQHAAQITKLPLHHRDPFDRILVAQSLSEPMRLLTRDHILRKYGELVLLA